MDVFFAHENHPLPPSLASNGVKHQTSKSDLMECLESLATQPQSVPDTESVKILNGAAIVHMLDPKRLPVRTFQDYSQLVFLPYIDKLLQDVSRIDTV